MPSMELKRFDAGKARTLLEWLISLDDPEGLEDRRTVTLNQIIEKAKACFTTPDFRHPYISSYPPGMCANASLRYANSWCGMPEDHPDHIDEDS